MTDILNCDIQDVHLYNDTLDEQYIAEYVIKYLSVIISFIEYSYHEKSKNKDGYLNFVVHQGIQTMHHIFLNLLMYTKNIELVFSNLKKAYYYYIEFIQQIKRDEHQFLKFSVKDAILFVYKKTINDLDDQFIRQHVCDAYNQNVLNAVEEISVQWNELTYFISKLVRTDSMKLLSGDCCDMFSDLNNRILVLCQIQLTNEFKLLNVDLVKTEIKNKTSTCTEIEQMIKEIISKFDYVQINKNVYMNHL